MSEPGLGIFEQPVFSGLAEDISLGKHDAFVNLVDVLERPLQQLPGQVHGDLETLDDAVAYRQQLRIARGFRETLF